MPSPLSQFPPHGDGVLENVYHYLWSKNEISESPKIFVPDIVVYKFNQAQTWYFIGNNGNLLKKSKINLTSIKIEAVFGKKTFGSDIVACYLISNGNETTIEYFDNTALHNFLYPKDNKLRKDGILQKFVEPKGNANSMIRTVWSPNVCLLERRICNRLMADYKYDMYERAATYEGPPHNSISAPIRGVLLPTKFQKICQDIVDHISDVSFQKYKVTRLVANFKVDPYDNIWLLWCSSIRLDDSTLYGEVNTNAQSPVIIDENITIPRHIKLTDRPATKGITASSITPIFECPSCFLLFEAKKQYDIAYKLVIQQYEQIYSFLCSEGVFKWPFSPEKVKQLGIVGLGYLLQPHSKEYYEDPNDNIIPPVLRMKHENLKNFEYKKYKRDPLFLYKTVPVCEECYLVYTQTLSVPVENKSSSPSLRSTTATRFSRQKPDSYDRYNSWESNNNSPPSNYSPPYHAKRGKSPTKSASSMSSREERRTPDSRGGMFISSPIPSLPKRIELSNSPPIGATHNNNTFTSSSFSSPMSPLSTPPTSATPPTSEYYLGSYKESLAEREDAFFNQLYNDPNLHKNHPLNHMLASKSKSAIMKLEEMNNNNNKVAKSFDSDIYPVSNKANKTFPPLSPENNPLNASTGQRNSNEISPLAVFQRLSAKEEAEEILRKKKQFLLSQKHERDRRRRAMNSPSTKLNKLYDDAITESKTVVKDIYNSKHKNYLLANLEQIQRQSEQPQSLLIAMDDLKTGPVIEGI